MFGMKNSLISPLKSTCDGMFNISKSSTTFVGGGRFCFEVLGSVATLFLATGAFSFCLLSSFNDTLVSSVVSHRQTVGGSNHITSSGRLRRKLQFKCFVVMASENFTLSWCKPIYLDHFRLLSFRPQVPRADAAPQLALVAVPGNIGKNYVASAYSCRWLQLKTEEVKSASIILWAVALVVLVLKYEFDECLVSCCGCSKYSTQ